MATELIRQVSCDRCERVETRPLDQAKNEIVAPSSSARGTSTHVRVPEFVAVLQNAGGKPFEVELGDLCTPCFNTVRKALEAIAKKVEKKSPDRKAAKKS